MLTSESLRAMAHKMVLKYSQGEKCTVKKFINNYNVSTGVVGNTASSSLPDVPVCYVKNLSKYKFNKGFEQASSVALISGESIGFDPSYVSVGCRITTRNGEFRVVAVSSDMYLSLFSVGIVGA